MDTLSNHELSEYLSVAVDAAKKASCILSEHWGRLKEIRSKSAAGDLVTEADQRSEKVIIDCLTYNFPRHSINGEETGIHKGSGVEFMWVVDPLDGTTNYTHQLPMVAISIALLHLGKPIIGVVYNPIMEEMFTAQLGGGAMLNGKSIAVSKIDKIENSLLATGFAYDRRDTPDNNYAEFCYLTSHSQGVRRMGAAALDLAYVGAGRFDGFWERGLKPWDIAAGALIVLEAGGCISSYENGPLDLDSGRILASNGLIHESMSQRLLETKKVLKPILWDDAKS